MKSKILCLFLIIVFAGCGKKQKTENTNLPLDLDTVVAIDTTNQSSYRIEKEKDGTNTVYIKNSSFFYYQNSYKDAVIQQNQTSKQNSLSEGQESKIDVDIIEIKTSKKIRSFSVNADKIDFNYDNYYLATQYGCCGGLNDFELGEMWQNNIFLKCQNYVYDIYLSHNLQFYCGFQSVLITKRIN